MSKPKVAVWKFTSCDGCQLSLLDCEDELLSVADAVEIAFFMEATRRVLPGPYDISIVEGSISTPEEQQRIKEIRKQSQVVITLGACATAGGIQALRNFADVTDYVSKVYASPEHIKTLEKTLPISAYIPVDFELRGCPINKMQLLEVLSAYLQKRKARIANESVCYECKLNENICIMVAKNEPCLGPVTHAGCQALCPSYNRGCFGCYGPKESANGLSLAKWLNEDKNTSNEEIIRLFRSYNAWSEEFKEVSKHYEEKK
jgi:sulfhydrogenase subunit delta